MAPAADQHLPTDPRLLPWELFRSTFLEKGLPADIPVAGEPRVTLFLEQGGTRIGLRAPWAGSDLPDPRLRSVHVERHNDDLVVWTRDQDLYQPFYALLLDIADRIQVDGRTSPQAVNESVRGWRRLLAGLSGLSIEEQIGLTGELWTLARIVASRGPAGVHAWTGPSAEAHDFRIGNTELETKTTIGERRRHRISRLDQLQPSPECRLYLLSLHFTRAGLGAGWTLGSQIADLRAILKNHTKERDRLEALLRDAKWSDEDDHLYTDRYKARANACLIPVDDAFPRLTPDMVRAALGELTTRVDDLTYRVDVDGLGALDGSAEFLAVLPESAQ